MLFSGLMRPEIWTVFITHKPLKLYRRFQYLPSIPYLSTSCSSKNEFALRAGFRGNVRTKFWYFLEMRFLHLLFSYGRLITKWYIFYSETKLEKISIFLEEKYICVWKFNLIWPDLDFTLTSIWVKCKKNGVSIEFYVANEIYSYVITMITQDFRINQ